LISVIKTVELVSLSITKYLIEQSARLNTISASLEAFHLPKGRDDDVEAGDIDWHPGANVVKLFIIVADEVVK
jgi:hypothetical protein